MELNINDIEMIEKFIGIKNHGYYADGRKVTELYNRVLNKHVAVTNCGSCIRQRINELENALNAFKKLSEKKNDEQPKVEETKPVEEKPKKKAGRPKKQK